jgi:hypothetical protein
MKGDNNRYKGSFQNQELGNTKHKTQNTSYVDLS